MQTKFISLAIVIVFLLGCNERQDANSFAHALKILEPVKDLTVLCNGNSMLAMSGVYQGRVFTTSSRGMSGMSYGWFRQSVIEEGDSHLKLSQLGGEGRFWFGPEIGTYSVFFDPGDEQVAENVKISPELNSRLFRVLSQTDSSLTCGGEMLIRNANGYHFNLNVKREVCLKSKNTIENDLGVILKGNVSSVGFSAKTWVENTGDESWDKATGLLSIWDIGCMKTTANTVVIIPLTQDADSITTYFTKLDDSRIQIKNQTVFYKSDAMYMNKIGVQPELCTNVFGSYSPELNLLNIVKYNFDHDTVYVNSLWGHANPYKGDVINIFNGVVNDSFNWPFYEFESSSSSKELQVGEKLNHMQSIYHFEGEKDELDEICKKVLGVSLADAETAFE